MHLSKSLVEQPAGCLLRCATFLHGYMACAGRGYNPAPLIAAIDVAVL